ncbi:MAG: ABC transporter permease [Oscillospiraceae bacterium]|nr:ABC transporter permease [Oscillospiraceae bacterium]
MTFLLQQTLIYTVPLILVALAGVFAERSGIINLALEGIMIIGAFVGAWFVRSMQEGIWQESAAQGLLVLTLLITAAAGALFSLLLSFSAVKMKADQTIGGTALNLLAPAIVLFLVNIIFQQTTLNLRYDAPSWFMLFQTDFGFDRQAKLGLVGDLLLNKTYLTTYLGLLIYVALSVILYKTRFGLRLRACGEHPQAADSVGINVYRMRYLGTAISGALAGMGGFIYALTTSNGAANGDVAGFGFLALAVMIFGNWKPGNIAVVGFLFGLLKCISACSGTLDINGDGVAMLGQIGVSTYVYNMLPYVITLVVLAFTSKKSRAPKAEGIPYDKGQR